MPRFPELTVSQYEFLCHMYETCQQADCLPPGEVRIHPRGLSNLLQTGCLVEDESFPLHLKMTPAGYEVLLINQEVYGSPSEPLASPPLPLSILQEIVNESHPRGIAFYCDTVDYREYLSATDYQTPESILIEREERCAQEEMIERAVAAAIGDLSGRQMEMVRAIFEEGLTPPQAAQRMEVSRQRGNVIYDQALEKIRIHHAHHLIKERFSQEKEAVLPRKEERRTTPPPKRQVAGEALVVVSWTPSRQLPTRISMEVVVRELEDCCAHHPQVHLLSATPEEGRVSLLFQPTPGLGWSTIEDILAGAMAGTGVVNPAPIRDREVSVSVFAPKLLVTSPQRKTETSDVWLRVSPAEYRNLRFLPQGG